MTKINKNGSTPKQMAYARRIFGGQGVSKKQIALDVGYSRYSANSVVSKIENKPGFNNAMAKLAINSNNLALAAMAEFKARGFTDFSNKDLVGALNAIGNAWAKFNGPIRGKEDGQNAQNKNKLRTVIMQRVENQTINTTAEKAPLVEQASKPEVEEVKVEVVEDDMDF